MMRRKLILGLIGATLAAIVAGDYVFNRSSGAQEPPKKADAETKKSDALFDLLKKELDKPKTDDMPPLPPNPGGVAIPPPMPPVTVQPPLPEPMPPSNVKPGALEVVQPPLPSQGEITGPKPGNPASPLFGGPANPVQTGLPALKPNPPTPKEETPPPPNHVDQGAFPAIPPTVPSKPVTEKDNAVKPAIGTDSFSNVTKPQPPASKPETGPVHLKNSPWSLHIDIVNDQTIVTATVNKKHDFKIVCQQLDLQTTQGTLKAAGKVQINGEALQASCDHLTIMLSEDRLLLEGNGEVRIRKTTGSETKASVFELKGSTLNLRVSDMQASKFVETSVQQTVEDAGSTKTVVAVTMSDAKKWSPYGKLSRTAATQDGLPVWRLEDNNGQAVLRFVTRGNLSAYEGQTISVLGTTLGTGMLKVTHIAVP